MRKILAFAGAALFAVTFAAVAAAQDSSSQSQDSNKSKSMQSAGKSVKGTITKLDNDQKMLVIRDDSGQSTTVYWDASTRGGSDLKEGQVVTIQTVDRDGKTVATTIVAAPAKPY